MQRCEKCGRPIKYIATGMGINTACDAEKIEFVTENGFKKSGYLVHDCLRKLEVIENEENSGTNKRTN